MVIVAVESNFSRERQQQNKTQLNKLDLTGIQCENGDGRRPIRIRQLETLLIDLNIDVNNSIFINVLLGNALLSKTVNGN